MWLRIRVPSEDSNQTAQMRSLIRIFTGHIWIAKDVPFLQADDEDSDQTRSLVWIIDGSIGQKVRFHTAG